MIVLFTNKLLFMTQYREPKRSVHVIFSVSLLTFQMARDVPIPTAMRRRFTWCAMIFAGIDFALIRSFRC